uniref:Gag-pol polyprotein n=1 Tax=Timema shepardi TaxID=629360 RepID=A0A7R9B7U9_TIMSH|nr:unnamed protein product [Timema shepardi]
MWALPVSDWKGEELILTSPGIWPEPDHPTLRGARSCASCDLSHVCNKSTVVQVLGAVRPVISPMFAIKALLFRTCDLSHVCNKSTVVQVLGAVRPVTSPMLVVSAVTDSVGRAHSRGSVAPSPPKPGIWTPVVSISVGVDKCFGLFDTGASHSFVCEGFLQNLIGPYSCALPKMGIFRNLILDLERKGVVRSSKSPHASPALIIHRKGQGHRIVVDYRKLCDHPMPRIESSFLYLIGAKYYSLIDLNSSFLQRALSESSKKYTAFINSWRITCAMLKPS